MITKQFKWKANEATARVGAFARKFLHQNSQPYIDMMKKKCPTVNNSIIDCFQFLAEHFAATIYWKFTTTSPQVFGICILQQVIESSLLSHLQAHTVSICFSQPFIESSWESHRKLQTFTQQVISFHFLQQVIES